MYIKAFFSFLKSTVESNKMIMLIEMYFTKREALTTVGNKPKKAFIPCNRKKAMKITMYEKV